MGLHILVGIPRWKWNLWKAGVLGAASIVFLMLTFVFQVVRGNTTAATRADQPAFDPCLLPDEALVAAGVDPATNDPGISGIRTEGHNLCTWTAERYFLGVAAATQSIDDLRANPHNTDFAPAVVGSRDAFSYHDDIDTNRMMCDVAFEGPGGTIVIKVDTKASPDEVEDPCVVATRSANVLDPYFPRPYGTPVGRHGAYVVIACLSIDYTAPSHTARSAGAGSCTTPAFAPPNRRTVRSVP